MHITISWSDVDDRSRIRDGTSVTLEVGRQVGLHWRAVIHCSQCSVSTATLKRMRSGTRSQWWLASASVVLRFYNFNVFS